MALLGGHLQTSRYQPMRQLRFWLGIVVSIVCLALAVRDVNLAEVQAALVDANYAYVLLVALLTLAGLVIRALRWRLLFYPMKGLVFGKVLTVLSIGYLLMNVLPARLGDVARAYLLGDLTGVSKARALSTIVVERVADVLVVVLFLSSLVFLIPLPEWAVQSGVALGAGFLALAVFLVLFANFREGGIGLLRRVVSRVRWLDREGLWRLVDSLMDGLEILRHPAQGGVFFGISVLIWVVGIAQFYFGMVALDLGLPVEAAIFVMCVTALGMTVPSTPGYIGVWEYIIVLSLSLFGVDKSRALSCALVIHAVVYLSTTAAGVISLWRESLAMAILREEVLPQGKS